MVGHNHRQRNSHCLHSNIDGLTRGLCLLRSDIKNYGFYMILTINIHRIIVSMNISGFET